MRLRSLLVTALRVLIVLTSAGLPIESVSARSVGADSAFVDVPIYVQQRNLSCEYASLVIAMGSYDTWVSEWTFDELVPASDNPHWGYRGDINGAWGNTTDYGVYPEPLVGPLAELGFRGEVFYARGDASSLKRYLANGVPVILWLGMWGDQSYYEYASDGTPWMACRWRSGRKHRQRPWQPIPLPTSRQATPRRASAAELSTSRNLG